MKKVVVLLLAAAGLLTMHPLCGGEGLYTGQEIRIKTPVDRSLEKDWKARKLLPVYEAPDSVLVRRLYLDLAGRLPSVEEAKSFVYSKDPGKYEKLVDELLDSPDFTAYWSMRWGDVLRIKSEFPINLWPNAVYIYLRRVRIFLEKNERYDNFVRALLLAEGSNFRVAEANFYRAHADRSPYGIARNTALTFCGMNLDRLPVESQKGWSRIFEEIGFKSTKEWKEEIVYVKSMPERSIRLPDGTQVTIPAGGEARKVLADYLTRSSGGRRLLARALVNRVWFWFFGAGLIPGGDDIVGKVPVNRELMEKLTDDVLAGKFDFKKLCRTVVCSAAYRSASFQGKETRRKAAAFAAYPVRRMEAEVLDDAVRDLTGIPSLYSSVIPEPFTFIPENLRTVEIADGSITSSFLILFGRPSRDAGILSERNDTINAKQRLFLFNSGALYRRVCRILRRPEYSRLPFKSKIEALYWMFYSRPPSRNEWEMINRHYLALPPKKRWTMQDTISWILVNSAEFLHRH